MKIGEAIEQVETARTIVYDNSAYLSRGEGFPPNMSHLIKLSAAAAGKKLAGLVSELLGLGIIDFRRADCTTDYWQMFLRGVVSCGGGGGSAEILHDVIAARHFGIARA